MTPPKRDKEGADWHSTKPFPEALGLNSKEAQVLADLIAEIEKRQDHLEDDLPAFIKKTFEETINNRVLTDEQREWVRLSVEAAGRRAQLQRAIIEKTLAGLLWVILAALGTAAYKQFMAWIVSHGWKQ